MGDFNTSNAFCINWDAQVQKMTLTEILKQTSIEPPSTEFAEKVGQLLGRNVTFLKAPIPNAYLPNNDSALVVFSESTSKLNSTAVILLTLTGIALLFLSIYGVSKYMGDKSDQQKRMLVNNV